MLVFCDLLAFVVNDYSRLSLTKKFVAFHDRWLPLCLKPMTGVNRLKLLEHCCASHKTWETPFFCFTTFLSA